jgi:hypothetical protein
MAAANHVAHAREEPFLTATRRILPMPFGEHGNPTGDSLVRMHHASRSYDAAHREAMLTQLIALAIQAQRQVQRSASTLRRECATDLDRQTYEWDLQFARGLKALTASGHDLKGFHVDAVVDQVYAEFPAKPETPEATA